MNRCTLRFYAELNDFLPRQRRMVPFDHSFLRRFDLWRSITPFQRCLRCNGLLQPVDKHAVYGRLPPLTREAYEEFYECPVCDRIYWKGSHYDQMRSFIAAVIGDQES